MFEPPLVTSSVLWGQGKSQNRIPQVRCDWGDVGLKE